jgi:YbbR domain-containing protein
MKNQDDEERFEATGPIAARVWARATDNLSLKIISVLVAVALFVVLHSGSDAQRTIDVDLFERMPDDPNIVLLTQLPSRVRVTVRGPRALLDELSTNVDPVTLDLTKSPERVDFKNLDYKLPTGVKVLPDVGPPPLKLRWDVNITKRVPVEPTWTALPEGLVVRNLSVDPSTVAVTGPKSILDVMQRLRTMGLNLSNLPAGSHTQSVLLDVSENPALVGSMQLGAAATVKPEVDAVEAKFDLVPETKTRTFANLPVLVLGGKGATLRPAKVTVVVTCPPRRADELAADAIVPKIDLVELGPDLGKKGPEETDVKIDVPGCSDVDVTPPRVAVSR